MTFWQRTLAAIRQGARGNAHDINRIEIHYEGESLPPYIIQGGDESHGFLAMYTSFDEVEAALALPGKIEHISCMNMLKDYKMKTDKGGIEEYYRNRPSLLEQEATNLVKKP